MSSDELRVKNESLLVKAEQLFASAEHLFAKADHLVAQIGRLERTSKSGEVDRLAVGDRYAELARYYQGHGEELKGNLLNVVPWLLAVGGALLGFAIVEGGMLHCWDPVADWLSGSVTIVRACGDAYEPGLAIILSALALVVTLLAMRVGKDIREHVHDNRQTAIYARARVREVTRCVASSMEAANGHVHPEIEVLDFHAGRLTPDKGIPAPGTESILRHMESIPRLYAWLCLAILLANVTLRILTTS